MSRERFISDLTKNGAYSKEEAEELADQEFSGKTPTPNPVSPYDETAAAQDLAASQAQLTGERSLAHKNVGEIWDGLSTGQKAALIGGLGLVGVSSTIGLVTAGKKIKDRLISKPQEIDRTIDIPMDKTVAPAPTTQAPPKSLLSEQEQQMLLDSERNRQANLAEAEAKAATQNKPLPSKSGFVGPESPFQGPKLPEFIGPPESPFVGPKLPPFVGPPESDIFGPPKPIAPPEIPQAEAPAATSAETEKPAGKKRGPKTAEQKAAEAKQLQELIAAAPEGRLPSAPQKTNKLLPTDVIGQGGWHSAQAQYGPETEAIWEKTFGKKNVSYDDVQKAWEEGVLPKPVVPEGKKGNNFKRQTTVPNYIRGAVAPGTLGPLAALAGALGIAATPDAQAAMQRAAGAIKDIGVSPDLLQGKGEELGRLGSAYVTAGNPQFRAQLEAQISKETDAARYKQLMEEYKKAGGNVGGGRGIAPPAAYMR